MAHDAVEATAAELFSSRNVRKKTVIHAAMKRSNIESNNITKVATEHLDGTLGI